MNPSLLGKLAENVGYVIFLTEEKPPAGISQDLGTTKASRSQDTKDLLSRRQGQRGLNQCFLLPSLKHAKVSQGGQDASSKLETCTLRPSLYLGLGLGSLIE
jgi:hypothetical protein